MYSILQHTLAIEVGTNRKLGKAKRNIRNWLHIANGGKIAVPMMENLQKTNSMKSAKYLSKVQVILVFSLGG